MHTSFIRTPGYVMPRLKAYNHLKLHPAFTCLFPRCCASSKLVFAGHVSSKLVSAERTHMPAQRWEKLHCFPVVVKRSCRGPHGVRRPARFMPAKQNVLSMVWEMWWTQCGGCFGLSFSACVLLCRSSFCAMWLTSMLAL